MALTTLIINYLMLVFNMYVSRELRLAFIHSFSLASSAVPNLFSRYSILETKRHGKIAQRNCEKHSVTALENIQATLVPL